MFKYIKKENSGFPKKLFIVVLLLHAGFLFSTSVAQTTPVDSSQKIPATDITDILNIMMVPKNFTI